MSADLSTWNSFWDLTTPEEAADALRSFYGPTAAKAAGQCATAARGDGRESDYRFWLAVSAALKGGARSQRLCR